MAPRFSVGCFGHLSPCKELGPKSLHRIFAWKSQQKEGNAKLSSEIQAAVERGVPKRVSISKERAEQEKKDKEPEKRVEHRSI